MHCVKNVLHRTTRALRTACRHPAAEPIAQAVLKAVLDPLVHEFIDALLRL
ncbi:hypothetical protein ACWEQL_39500 [Kitasatospora sp. NPDC004240]